MDNVVVKEKGIQVRGGDLALQIARGDVANDYSPIKCLTKLKVTSIEQSLSANLPTLVKIKKEKGEEYVKSYIMAWLVVLNEQLNLKRTMTEIQVILTASMILENFYFFKISDLKLIFTKILSGEYNLYEGIDTAKIMNIFYDYKIKRMTIAYERESYSDVPAPRSGLLSITQGIERVKK